MGLQPHFTGEEIEAHRDRAALLTSHKFLVGLSLRRPWCVPHLLFHSAPLYSVRRGACVRLAVVVSLHRQALGGDVDELVLALCVFHLHHGRFRVTEWAGPITRKIGYHVTLIHWLFAGVFFFSLNFSSGLSFRFVLCADIQHKYWWG